MSSRPAAPVPAVEPAAVAEVAWHALPAPEAAARLASTERGLDAAKVAGRQARYGRNELPQEPPPSA